MIVLTTPTGAIGSRLLTLLRDAGEPVRAIARDPSKLPDGADVDVVAGSHGDPEVMDRALRGADALFLLVPPNPGAASPADEYVRFGRVAAEAVVRHGVPRVVFVSSYGRGIESGAGLLTCATLLEAEVNRSGTATRALRPPYFMENLLHLVEPLRAGVLPMSSDPDRVLPMVATADIAARAAELLMDSTWTGQEGVAVAGPDDLTPRQIAAELGVALQPMTSAHDHALMLSHGASEGFAEAMAEMVDAQNRGVYDDDTLPSRRGETSLRTWISTELKPLL